MIFYGRQFSRLNLYSASKLKKKNESRKPEVGTKITQPRRALLIVDEFSGGSWLSEKGSGAFSGRRKIIRTGLWDLPAAGWGLGGSSGRRKSAVKENFVGNFESIFGLVRKFLPFGGENFQTIPCRHVKIFISRERSCTDSPVWAPPWRKVRYTVHKDCLGNHVNFEGKVLKLLDPVQQDF